MDTNLFAALQREWVTRSSSAEAERVLREIAALEPVIAKTTVTNLGQLFSLLDRRSPVVTDEPWVVIGALVRQLEVNELISLGLLVVLIPTMSSVASRLQWGQGGPWAERDEFIGELVATTWTVLTDLAGTTLAYPVQTIKHRVSSRLERVRSRELRSRRREIPTLFDEINDQDEAEAIASEVHTTRGLADPRPIPVLDSLAHVLCEVDESVIDHELVRLVYAHRVLGYPISELSVILGAGEDELEYQAHRAEVLLCAS